MGTLRVAVVVCCLILAAPASAAAMTWHQVFAPDAGDPTTIEAISAAPDGPVWAVGGLHTADAYDVPTAWRKARSTWKAFRVPVDLTGRWGYLSAVSADAGNDVWAVGQTLALSTGQTLPLVGHWDGRDWSVVSQPWLTPGWSGSFSAVVASSPHDVWVGGARNVGVDEPVVWHFDGFTWSELDPPLLNPACQPSADARVLALTATTDGLYVALTCTTPAFGQAGMVERFTGRRWRLTLALSQGGRVAALAAAADGTVWAGGAMLGGSVLVAHAWSGGPGHLREAPIAGPGDSHFDAVAVDAGGNVYLAGEWFTSTPGPLFRSRIGGTWTQESVPYDRGLDALAADARGHLFTGGPTFGGWLGGSGSHPAIFFR